jgi:acetyltransferase-like isoleucine patch superfamily enzyme
MKKFLTFVGNSEIIKAAFTLVIYVGNAAILGISLAPSIFLLVLSRREFLMQATPLHVFEFSIACGAAVFVYFITGTIVMSIAIRILSIGMGAGKYPMFSFTVLRWLVYSGVYHLAGKTILDFLPMSFLCTIFFRITGAKIGKNVSINSWYLNDAYLLEIGDNVVIGGKTDISCHTFENNSLILQRITIGSNTLVGQQCYISPGVSIGSRCVIGQYSFIRKNTNIPDRSVIASLGGLPIREITRLERRAKEDQVDS